MGSPPIRQSFCSTSWGLLRAPFLVWAFAFASFGLFLNLCGLKKNIPERVRVSRGEAQASAFLDLLERESQKHFLIYALKCLAFSEPRHLWLYVWQALRLLLKSPARSIPCRFIILIILAPIYAPTLPTTHSKCILAWIALLFVNSQWKLAML